MHKHPESISPNVQRLLVTNQNIVPNCGNTGEGSQVSHPGLLSPKLWGNKLVGIQPYRPSLSVGAVIPTGEQAVAGPYPPGARPSILQISASGRHLFHLRWATSSAHFQVEVESLGPQLRSRGPPLTCFLQTSHSQKK